MIVNARRVTSQWKFNGTNIPGATTDSLVLNNITAANEGHYSVAVTMKGNKIVRIWNSPTYTSTAKGIRNPAHALSV